MTQDQKGCKKNNVGAEEEQITTARTKQHEDEEGDTGIRPFVTQGFLRFKNGPFSQQAKKHNLM